MTPNDFVTFSEQHWRHTVSSTQPGQLVLNSAGRLIIILMIMMMIMVTMSLLH